MRWTRRDFARRALLGAAGLAATPMQGCGPKGDTARPKAKEGASVPRGVLLITADDLGWKDVGAYGLETVATPALDLLVAEGVAFSHAFDVVSTCSSSRATITTGHYPHTHGVTGLTHRHPELSLPPGYPTLVRTLWNEGVVTAVQGKWHLSAHDPPEAFAFDQHLYTEVLDGMDALGLTEDTLVVFVSDNGPDFPGCKTTLYDRGVGTPLVFRWPAVLAPRWEEELVNTAQLAPTILELAGATPLPAAQGRSIAPLLLDRDWEPTEVLFGEMEMHSGSKPARSARTRTHKYIRNYTSDPWGSGGGDGAWKDLLADEPDQTWDEPRPPVELFDLVADPLERTNLAGDAAHAVVEAELAAALDAHLAATADPRLGTSG